MHGDLKGKKKAKKKSHHALLSELLANSVVQHTVCHFARKLQAVQRKASDLQTAF